MRTALRTEREKPAPASWGQLAELTGPDTRRLSVGARRDQAVAGGEELDVAHGAGVAPERQHRPVGVGGPELRLGCFWGVGRLGGRFGTTGPKCEGRVAQNL